MDDARKRELMDRLVQTATELMQLGTPQQELVRVIKEVTV